MCIFVIYIQFFPYCLFVSNSQVIGCEDSPEMTYTVSGGALNSAQYGVDCSIHSAQRREKHVLQLLCSSADLVVDDMSQLLAESDSVNVTRL